MIFTLSAGNQTSLVLRLFCPTHTFLTSPRFLFSHFPSLPVFTLPFRLRFLLLFIFDFMLPATQLWPSPPPPTEQFSPNVATMLETPLSLSWLAPFFSCHPFLAQSIPLILPHNKQKRSWREDSCMMEWSWEKRRGEEASEFARDYFNPLYCDSAAINLLIG